jgi:hypothetical protein
VLDLSALASLGPIASVTLSDGPNGSAALAQTACELPDSGEFGSPLARIRPIVAGTDSSPNLARTPVPHPQAPWVLAAGLGLLAAAVALGWERGRGSRVRTPARGENQAVGQVRR